MPSPSSDLPSVSLLRARQTAEVESAYITSMAVKIQKVYRGHHSRLHYADFYRRRLYLQQVTRTGEQLSQSMQASSSLLHSIASEAAAQAHDSQVRSVFAHTHHLLSTATIPGVFSGRWGDEWEAKVDGVGVEVVIKEVWKERQAELRRLREEVKRERRKLRMRREVVEMRMGIDDDGPVMVGEEEEEAKVQLMDEGMQEEEEEEDREAVPVNVVEVTKREVRTQDGYVRFPPIHPRPTSAEDAAWKVERQREAVALNRSIILSRDGRAITVERPKHKSTR